MPARLCCRQSLAPRTAPIHLPKFGRSTQPPNSLPACRLHPMTLGGGWTVDNIQELPAAQSRVIPPEQEADGLRIPRGLWILPVALLAMYSTSFLLLAAKAEQTVFGWEVFGACVRSGVLLGLLPNFHFLG